MSTLWNKGTAATEVVDAFTVGNDRILDIRLAKYDVIGSMAHIKMLESIGLLTSEELVTLTSALEQILKEIKQRDYQDTHREIAPLKMARDSIKLDTSDLSIEEVVAEMRRIVKEKIPV